MLVLKKDVFVDLEKVRLDILKQKTQEGLNEFQIKPSRQWTPLRLEKPLLETLLDLIEKEELRRSEIN